ncbi:hypothetical protein [Hymenobacter rubripertinctus]|uniref:DUF3311 domain-containing protein n=1 Tax=Hymenobacter rubripertinctus TaxID=2029981 RepID=A0A418R0P6_9BACT|nr:hypothetical protein [Hymenobacter rubripertinctus]RIY10993.1 hypothetical protein D0T11_08245 [Hymenobacter rubripertinctus]
MPPISPPERPEQRRGQQLLFVALLFGVLLNFPLLGAFNHAGRVAGIPVLYLYVLVTWAALVLVTGWVVRGIKN